jgi:hypothetical protein
LFRFFKNIINTVIILLALIGLFSLYKQNAFEGITGKVADIFSSDKEKVEAEVGDFTQVDNEFKIDTAVKVMGYKTVVAKHSSTGQKMIIVDSGKKTLLTEHDITSDHIKEKLEELTKKVKYHSISIESIDITDRGTMTTFGKRVPYVKFNAKLSHFPKKNISGIVSVVDTDKKNQRLIISLNDQKPYSQLITSEFYKNVKDNHSVK